MNLVAYAQKKTTLLVYSYNDDDSLSARLIKKQEQEFDDGNRLVYEKVDDVYRLFFYKDTFLVKELEVSPERDGNEQDTSITHYYYDNLKRLLFKKNRKIIYALPAGYGIAGPKGCEIPASEIKRKWDDVYLCNYYIYDAKNNLIVDSSFFANVNDSHFKKTRKSEIHNYKYSSNNKVVRDIRRWYHQTVDRDTIYYLHNDSGYVSKHRLNRSYFTDTIVLSSGKIISEKHTHINENEPSNMFVQYYYLPDNRLHKTITYRSNPSPYLYEAAKTTEIYKYD